MVISIDTTTEERWKERLSGKKNTQDTKEKILEYYAYKKA
jgi:hypothetical protein